MKKILIILMVFAFAINSSKAQFSISGFVKDNESKESLPGASVSITKSSKSSMSDYYGKYKLKDIPSGKIKIKCSYIGYQDIYIDADIDKNDTINKNYSIDINLQKSPIMLGETNIFATRLPDKSPATFKNITLKEIEYKNQGQDLPFMLSHTPSVVATSDAGAGVGYTSLRIRGSDLTRVNVTVNGIPINDPESHGVFFVNMPDFFSSIDNIQVQRGVGTSSNGAASFGGSLNMQTIKPSIKPYCEINNAAGTFNTFKHNVMFGTGVIDGKWSFDARLSKISSDGYVDRAWSDLKSYFLTGGYFGKTYSLKAVVFSGKENTYQSWDGVSENMLKENRTFNQYTYENQTDNYQQDHYQLIFTKDINKNLNLNLATHYTYGRGYYEEFKDQQDLAKYTLPNVIYGMDTITNSDIIRQLWLDNDFYGFTYSGNYVKGKFKLSVGGAYNIYEGRHYDKVIWASNYDKSALNHIYDDNNAVKKDFNVFGKIYYQMNEKLSMLADLQYRNINYEFLGFNELFETSNQNVTLGFYNPKAGINYQFNKILATYFSVGIGNKEPNRNDYVESTPLSRPKSEQMYDYELGLRFNTSKIKAELAAYYMMYDNQLVLTGKLNDVGAYTRTNIPESYRRGIEFSVDYIITKNISIYLDATLSQNKIKHFNEYIDNYDDYSQVKNEYNETDISFSPSVISSSIIKYQPIKNFSINLSNKYVGKQYLDNTSNDNRKLNEYFINDINFSYSFNPKFIREVNINFSINNFMDKKYESNGYSYSYIYFGEQYTENYFYPQAGINYMVGLAFKF